MKTNETEMSAVDSDGEARVANSLSSGSGSGRGGKGGSVASSEGHVSVLCASATSALLGTDVRAGSGAAVSQSVVLDGDGEVGMGKESKNLKGKGIEIEIGSKKEGRRGLLEFPDEILLHIFSYLDLPDLALLARLSPALASLTADPVLHLHRLRIVSPSRVSHGLFARDPHGHPLRPSVPELVHRGVLRGLGIERAWRMGGYWGSARSIVQYENGRALARRLACNILATQLRRRAALGTTTTTTTTTSTSTSSSSSSMRVHPDIEGSSPRISRALLPTMRKLKWCLQRDRLARVFKESGVRYGSVGAWLATPAGAEIGWRVLVRASGSGKDEEKLRLAVCPDIRKARGVFEALTKASA